MVLPLIAGALGYFAPGAILSGAGFTAAGIKAGSIAAGIQGIANNKKLKYKIMIKERCMGVQLAALLLLHSQRVLSE